MTEEFGSTLPPPRGFRRTKPSEAVQNYLRDRIFSAQWRPGQWVRLGDLAERFSVSATPIREGVAVLVDEGLLIVQQRRGISPRPLLRDDVKDNFLVFAYTSGLLAWHAAARVTPAQVDELKRLHAQMALETDPVLLDELNWAFHRKVNYIGASVRLLNIMRFLSRNIPRRYFFLIPTWRDMSQSYHEDLIEALEQHDPGRARAISSSYTETGADMLLAYLDEQQLLLGSPEGRRD